MTQISKIVLFLIALGATVSANSVLAADGSGHSGGGDVQYPTADEVRLAIARTTYAPEAGHSNARDALYELRERRHEISRPELAPVLQKMFEWKHTDAKDGDYAVRWELAHATVEVDEGPCTDNGSPHAAGALYKEGVAFDGTPFVVRQICYSIPLLQQIPKDNLEQQLLALTVHELVHLLGFGETEARAIQSVLLEEGQSLVKSAPTSDDWVRFSYCDVHKALKELRQVLANSKSKMGVCLKIGNLTTSAWELEFQVETAKTHSSTVHEISWEAYFAVSDLWNRSQDMEGYCGEISNRDGAKPVPQGNNAELDRRLSALTEAAAKLGTPLGLDYSDYLSKACRE